MKDHEEVGLIGIGSKDEETSGLEVGQVAQTIFWRSGKTDNSHVKICSTTLPIGEV